MKRIRYNRADLNSTMEAAKKLVPCYVFATAVGYTIDKHPAPFGQTCYKVTADKVELIEKKYE